MKHKISQLIGIQLDTTQHKEKLISASGGFISIFLIFFISSTFLENNSAALVVASMGASAVLLFAVPHGPLSQPWPVFGGHLLSATIGISCYFLIPNQLLAASVAVGASIAIMYYFRCIHPPGGATAFTAVIGGGDVHQLGYEYLLTPVLLNVIIILAVAFAFNYLFSWRRYPAILSKRITDKKELDSKVASIPKEDLEFALKSMQSFTDISEPELENIYKAATQHELNRHLNTEDIILGHYYIHGVNSGSGVIKRIIDESSDEKDMIIYKIITGPESKKTAASSREAFALWAKHEVIFKNKEWTLKS
ncbi:MAG: HPP family protein [Pseudomonadota bacterium]